MVVEYLTIPGKADVDVKVCSLNRSDFQVQFKVISDAYVLQHSAALWQETIHIPSNCHTCVSGSAWLAENKSRSQQQMFAAEYGRLAVLKEDEIQWDVRVELNKLLDRRSKTVLWYLWISVLYVSSVSISMFSIKKLNI